MRILSPKTFAARFFLAGSLLCFSFLNAVTLNLPWNINVSALSYQQDVGVSFTFTPTVRLTLSTTDIHIYNLAPGAASDSNIITLNILTNTANGYTLNASVGNDTTFNTNELIHSNSNISNTFSNLSTTASLASNTDLGDNEWGYSYLDEAVDKGSGIPNTIWENYSGLPLYSDTTNIANLKTSTTPVDNAGGDNIKFKIAAKASTTQPSGEYNNVINFTLVATPIPTTISMAYENAGKEKHLGYYKMQDMTSEICNAVEVLDEGSQTQVIDIRDNKVYWITKLRDGKCWMTQNLDLDLDSTITYTHNDTDLGWGSDTTTTSWTPLHSTIDASGVTNNQISDWVDDFHMPYSVNPGDVYWNNSPFYVSTANLFLDNDWGSNPIKFQKDTSFTTNGAHGHVGNYYNWTASVASNDTSGYASNTFSDISANPQNSICPAGWRLPTFSNDSGDIVNSKDEFVRLNLLYNNSDFSSSEDLEKAPLYFVRSGFIENWRQKSSGSVGYYYSSTVGSSVYAYLWNFSSDLISTTIHGRGVGASVRCVAR